MITTSLAILWRPYFPPIVTAGCVALLLGLAVYVCVRTFRLRPSASILTLLMRATLVVLVGLVLMGPSGIDRPTDSTAKPGLRILIDTSASMQTPDADSMPRFEFAAQRWLSDRQLYELREDYDVEVVGFDESTQLIRDNVLRKPAIESATADVSNVAGAVRWAVSNAMDDGGPGREDFDRVARRGSAVLVMSDGRDSLDAPMHPVGQLAKRRLLPVHTVALGGPSMSRDVAVIASPQQPYLFAEEPGRVSVRVMQSNAGRSSTVLHVARDGEEQTFPIVFEGRDTVTVDVPIVHDEPGTYEYRVWVDTITGEAETANNEQPVFVDVTAKRLRVLILEGQPYWDTKFLAYALRRDSRIELTQITQLSPDKHETIVTDEQTESGVPQSLEALTRFDVVILGRDIGKVLTPDTAGLLPKYVADHGGRVVFARGRVYEPGSADGRRLADALSVLEPVVFGDDVMRNQKIVLEPAEMGGPGFGIGAGSDAYDRDEVEAFMPTLLTLPQVVREKAATRVLARAHRAGVGHTGDHQPAIVTMPYGRGMVAAVLGDGLWTWGLSPKQRRAGGDTFERFWMDMVRWLALGSDYQPGKDITVRLSRRGVAVGDPISLDVVSRSGFDGVQARVVIDTPGGETIESALGPVPGSTTRRRAYVYPDQPGVHRVRVIETNPGDNTGSVTEAKFNCYHIDIERLYTSADRGALRTLSELSGGRCLDPAEPEALKALLDKQREAAKTPATPYYLWDRGWVLGLILMWAGAEWLLRRAGGLL